MFHIIIHDITTAFIEYIPYAAVTGALFIFFIWIISCLGLKRRISDIAYAEGKLFALLYVFYVYIFITVAITLLSREPGSRNGMDLRLFSTFSYSLDQNIYPVENILLFIPFGFMLPLLRNKFGNVFICLSAGFIFSLAIETLQYITQRGYAQIDDVITNSFGTLIGYGMVSLITRWEKTVKKARIRDNRNL